jgi:hypothetical protein
MADMGRDGSAALHVATWVEASKTARAERHNTTVQRRLKVAGLPEIDCSWQEGIGHRIRDWDQ